MIYFVLKALLGMIMFYAYLSSKYIYSGKFDYKVWMEKNLSIMLWNTVIVVLFSAAFFIEPESMNVFAKFLGLNVESFNDMPIHAIGFGGLLSFLARTQIKSISK